MLKVYISPFANDGILRVIEAQYEHLPKFGVEPTKNLYEADVICNHGTMLDEVAGVPSVHVGHGAYWSRQPWGDGFMEVNRDVVETMRHAVAWTVPSEWVNTAIRRGGYFYPEVVYHGIDGKDFLPSKKHDNYILWNKARTDYVSTPKDVMEVARIMSDRQFVSTFGIPDANLKIVGAQPHPQMKKLVSEAGVYLATVRETFGIGTLEALAYGIPVAGFNWGGNSEIIIQGKTGYLAPPGDYKALAECIELCIANRETLSKNAIEDARTRWKWEPRIEQYANIFKRVYARYHNNNPKVSVIVTAYKLDQYLPACLDSIMRQTYMDFECLVIDDASLDSTRMIVSDYAKRDKRIRYIPTPNNFGLVGARNFGLSNSSGNYIRHMDADDFLADNALELEVAALDTDRGVDIVYGHLEVVRTDGSRVLQNGEPVRGGWPENEFSWYRQMAHLNQLPSCVMARREVYERSGGYRERMKRNEDAEFWCRVTSLGFRAKKFTQAVTYFHRERPDSKGAVEWEKEGSEPDWTAWFPWRMGASDYRTARDVLRRRGDSPKNSYLVPFGAQGKPPQGLRFWYVHDHAYPVVSIVVTVGPGHKQYLLDALDSIQAQNYPDWECIVVNDTGAPWSEDIMGAPWAKVVNMDGNRGASAARNEGYKHTKGKYIVWMDADDYWMPWFLEKMVGYAEVNSGVIYSDFLMQETEKSLKIYRYATDFNSKALQSGCATPGTSVLIPRFIVDAVVESQGGWDTEIEGLEDWDMQVAICAAGFCFYHIPEPLFVYRIYSSTKRDADFKKRDTIGKYVEKKWNLKERKMCGCTSSKIPKTTTPSSMLSASGNFTTQSIAAVIGNDGKDKSQKVTIEYLGDSVGTFGIKSKFARGMDNQFVTYRFGNNDQHRIHWVFLGDAEWLVGLNDGMARPLYRILSSAPVEDANDPAAFVGVPITA
jgi:glycosyltransferase involved in cell wall biosynthesis